MIQVIYGKKGSGKTKKIIDMANDAVRSCKGDLVFIDDDNRYMFDVSREVRFVNATEYGISNPEMFMGFVCGMLAGNYDMEQLFVDGFLRLVKCDLNEMGDFFAKLEKLAKEHGVEMVFSISAKDDAEAPEFLKPYLIK